MNKVMLFINGDLGLHLIEEIQTNQKLVINSIVLNSVVKCSEKYKEKVENHEYVKNLSIPIYNYSDDLHKNKKFQSILDETSLGISALFGHLLPLDFLNKINFRIFNLHPSLLPYGRGADPVAWAIIDNGPQGATIHEIDSGIDTGVIVSQQHLASNIAMTAGEIYELAMESLKTQLSIFLSRWPDLGNFSKANHKSSFKKSTDLVQVRKSLMEDGSQIEKVIRTIQALTFNDGRVPVIHFSDGHLWTVKVECTKVEDNIGL